LSLSADGALAATKMRGMIAYFGPYLEEEALAKIGLTCSDFAPIKARTDVGDYAGAQSLVTEPMLKLAIVGTPGQVIFAMIEDLASAGVDEIGLGGPLGPDRTPRSSCSARSHAVFPGLIATTDGIARMVDPRR
jgi:5,10-methylenetetrahydromethanopterin reductase